MGTEPLNAVLLTLFYSERRMVAGRTLLQKTLYFVARRVGIELSFKPHFYGPYSVDLAELVEGLRESGLICQRSEPLPSYNFGASFEPRRYTYYLTDEGTVLARVIEQRRPGLAQAIRQILATMKQAGIEDDYKSLSVAAKVHHILGSRDQTAGTTVIEEAQKLNWSITNEEAESAARFLALLGEVCTTALVCEDQ
jgi:hypothetical protein